MIQKVKFYFICDHFVLIISCRPSDLGSLLTVTMTHRFVPTSSGPWKLLVSLDCQQLTHVHGVADILVKEK